MGRSSSVHADSASIPTRVPAAIHRAAPIVPAPGRTMGSARRRQPEPSPGCWRFRRAPMTSDQPPPRHPRPGSRPRWRWSPILSADLDDVSLAQARAVVDGEVDDWADLGGEPGPVRVVESVVRSPPAWTRRSRAGRRRHSAGPRLDDRWRRIRCDQARTSYSTQPSERATGRGGQPTIIGDIMLGRRVGGCSSDAVIRSAVFRPLAERLASADITVGNLESTLSRSARPGRAAIPSGPTPSVLEGLRAGRVRPAVRGQQPPRRLRQKAIVETLEKLEDGGLPDRRRWRRSRRGALSPWSSTVDGVRVGFVATDSTARPPPPVAARPGPIASTLPADRSAGQEGARPGRRLRPRPGGRRGRSHSRTGARSTRTEPEQSQRRSRRALADAGVDVVVGGHPHWVQGWETSVMPPSCTRSATSSSTWTSCGRPDEGIFVEIVSRGGRCRRDQAGAVRHRRQVHPAPGRREACR